MYKLSSPILVTMNGHAMRYCSENYGVDELKGMFWTKMSNSIKKSQSQIFNHRSNENDTLMLREPIFLVFFRTKVAKVRFGHF